MTDRLPLDSPARITRVVLVGVLAGAASGLFGVGGGVVIVPGLVILVAMEQHRAHGTSLTAIVPIAVVSTVGYALADEVDWLVAVLVVVGSATGAPLGVRLMARTRRATLQRAFSVLLLLTAVRLMLGDASGVGRETITVLGALGYAALGLVTGVLAGLMGVAGGVIIVPALALIFGFPLVLAKGTSLAVVVPTAAVGTVRNLREGTTDLRAGAVVGVSGIVTAAIASQISLGLDERVSAVLFGLLLVAVAIRMLRRVADD